MKNLFILIIGIFILIGGCVGSNKAAAYQEIAKNQPQIKQFLENYPNSTITVTYLDETSFSNEIENFKKDCGRAFEIKAYYKITMISKDVDALTLIDESSEKVLCTVVKNKIPNKTEKQKEEIKIANQTNVTVAPNTPTIIPNTPPANIVKSKLKQYASSIGLDTQKFNICLDTSKYSNEIQKDFSDGLALGIQGVPSFMIGRRDGTPQTLVGAQPYSAFQAAIEAELANNKVNSNIKTSSFVDDDPYIGSYNAPILIIEFCDFQSPFCSRFYTGAYRMIVSNYVDTGQVQIIYRDFPLTNIDPNAQIAAEAAQCAFEQGKFKEMHDLLFINQSEWSNLLQ
ncbi:MAG: thioredoxin domain-containing protein [Candidatus Micrarchaeota archaeon]